MMLLNCGVGEDSWRIPWTAKRSNQSILKEISPGCSLEGLMLKLTLQYFATWCEELTQYFGHLMRRADPDAGKDWGQEEKGMKEDEMAGWHHWLNEHGFGWTPGVGDGHGGLAWCSSWGHKESNTTERLNWTWPFLIKLNVLISLFSLVFLQRIWTLTSTQNLHTDIYSSSIHNYENLVTTKLFFVRWMDK